MKIPLNAASTDRPLLRSAHAAVDQGDLHRADALFLEHLGQQRDDPVGLADYGNFCLRTGRPGPASYLLYKANVFNPGDANLLSQSGYARLDADDYHGAEPCFKAALAIDPLDASANYGFALCRQQSGMWTEAVAAFELALAAQPDALPIMLSLAIAYHRSGSSKQAGAHFERAEHIAPHDPAMLLEYGKFLRDTGAFPQAMRKFDRCENDHPNDPPVMLESARCLRAMGLHAQAMQKLEALSQLSPNMAECHQEFGNCCASIDRYTERDLHWNLACGLWVDAKQYMLAGPLLEQLLSTNPGYAPGWNLKGLFHDAQLQLESAEEAFLRAIEVDPGLLDSYVNLGNLYEHSNRIADARMIADAGLHSADSQASPPDAPVIGLHILRCKLARREKQYRLGLEHLDAIASMRKSDLEEQTEWFERAKLLDLLDETDAAVAAFNKANALARIEAGEENPQDNKFLLGVEYMLDLNAKGWLRTWRKLQPEPVVVNPVFLVGFPRSGTTLLNTVLYSHSSIQVIEEKQTIAKMLGAVRQMPLSYPHALAECDQYDVAYMREAYYQATAEYCTPDYTKLLVDKFPLHMATAGLIHRAFPQARFLFALRHPCDAVLSCFMQNFRLNEAMANFCTIGDTVALYTKTMDLWQAYREQLPLTVQTIRYEDVVDDFDGQIQILCNYLQVPWEEGLKQFSVRALDRGRINTPSYEQVSKPIYREARYRWERYREHLAPYLPALQPYIDRFGYSRPA